MNELTIVDDLDDDSIGGFVSAIIEAWGAKSNIECLPFAWRFAGIDARCMTLDILFIDPSGINAAAFDAGVSVLFHPVTVVNLDLVTAHKINAGVRMPGNAKLDVDLDITKLLFADEVNGFCFGSVDNNAFAGGDGESFGFGRIKRNGFSGHPFPGGLSP